MPQRIILFNGPPRCGKDTAASHCWSDPELNSNHKLVFERMSRPLKKAFAAVTDLNISPWDKVEHWEDRKEEIIPGFGVSYRQWQIDFSEKFMKPLYGENIFSKLFISRMKRQHADAVVFVPDCGFDIEYDTLVEKYGVDNILVVKIYRPDTTFVGDSRNYLRVGSVFIEGTFDAAGKYVAYLNNNGTQEEFEIKALKTVKGWLNR